MSGSQDSKDSVDGYDIGMRGMALGIDTGQMHDSLMIGVALIAGVAMIVADKRKRERSKTAVTPVATPNSAGLLVTGRF